MKRWCLVWSPALLEIERRRLGASNIRDSPSHGFPLLGDHHGASLYPWGVKTAMKKPDDWSMGYWIFLNVTGYIILILFALWIMKLIVR
jgi:hypothetical protein